MFFYKPFTFKKIKTKQGITLIETTVAITVLVVGVLSVFSFLTFNISQSTNIKNKIIALNLAQEGIEITKNIRDNNWITGRPFRDWDQDSSGGEATDLSAKLGSLWGNIFSDNFDRIDSTSLGINWVERSGNIDIVGNKTKLLSRGVGNDLAHTTGVTYPNADYSVQAVVNHNNTPTINITYLGVVGRRVNYGTDDSDGYYAFTHTLDTNGKTVSLFKKVSGNWALLGGATPAFSNTADYTIRLSMQGSTIKLFRDGTEYVSVTDTSLTAAGDAGISAGQGGNINILWDNFTVNNFTYTGVQNALVRASNGDIYIGANSGKFGKYTPGTDTFTDLTTTSGLSAFWGITDGIKSLTYDSTNNIVYLGGGYNGVSLPKFAKYTISTNTAINFSAKIPFDWGAVGINASVFDSTNNALYIFGDSNRFAKCQITNPCDGANGNMSDLTSKMSAIFNGYPIRTAVLDAGNNLLYLGGGDNGIFASCDLTTCVNGPSPALNLTARLMGFWSAGVPVHAIAFDSTNQQVYLAGIGGGGSNGFAKCSVSSCVQGTSPAINLTAKTSGFWGGNNIFTLSFNTVGQTLYIGGAAGKFAKCDVVNCSNGENNAIDLTGKISSFWSTNILNALAYDSMNNFIYLAGAGGKFAKCNNFLNCSIQGTPDNCSIPCEFNNNYNSIALTNLNNNLIFYNNTYIQETNLLFFETINSLITASNGDIYIGANSGKFGKYTPGTDTFTDLTTKISSFWGTDVIYSLTFDSTNSVVYIGGANGKFAKYTISTDTGTDLSSRISWFWSGHFILALTFDSINNVVYLAGGTQASTFRFAKYIISIDTATDLSAKLGSWWGNNIFSDNFDRIDSTSLGINWVERSSNIDIVGNKTKLLSRGVGNDLAHTTGVTYPNADYSVQAVVNHNNTPTINITYLGVVGRRVNYGTDDSDGYYAFTHTLDTNGKTVSLFKRVSGNWGLLGGATPAFSNTADYTIRLSMQGSTIKLFRDGTEYVSVTDTSLTAAGDAGISAGQGGNTDILWDNFTVDNLPYTDTQNALVRASNGDIYMGTNSGKFGKYTPGTDTFTDLTTKISSFWGTDVIYSLTFDSTNSVVYIGGANGKFAKYTISTDTGTDLSSRISWFWSGHFILALTFDSVNNVVYLAGGTQANTFRFAKYIISIDTATDLYSKISLFWSQNGINALAYDSTNAMIYLAGDGGKFAKCDSTCQNGTNPAINLSSNFYPNNTPFSREIIITDDPDGDGCPPSCVSPNSTEDIKVESIASWVEKGTTNMIKLEDRLYNWKQ